MSADWLIAEAAERGRKREKEKGRQGEKEIEKN
jgi:hypothetical protein